MDRIKRYYKRYPFILYAYALMPNHIHLAIETCEIPLSKIMQGLQQSYVLFVHKKYASVGHLFQGPYGAVLYEKEESASNLVRYIHRNPLEARLVKNPAHYPWCSHHIYMKMGNCTFLNRKFVLDMFPGDEVKAIQLFNEFVIDIPLNFEQLNFEDVKDRQIIGNKKFVEKVKTEIEISSIAPEIDLSNNFSAFRKKTLSEILNIVSKQTKVSADSILSPSRIRTITETRRIFVYISAIYAGHKTMEISNFLKKDSSSISWMINKLESEMVNDPILFDKIKQIIHIFNVWPRK